jgi:H+/Cl- antiporter ClcA
VNAALVALATAITCLLSPAAAGSGIPDVKVYLDGVVQLNPEEPFSRATLAAKALGSVGAVAGGLSVGKEGPFAHVGACVAASLADALSLPRRSRRRQDAVAFGAAAGVAAAFRAPLGGALFALEEAAGGAAPPRRLAPSLAATAATVVALRVASGRSPLLRGAVFPLQRDDASASGAPFLLQPRFVLPALLLGLLGGAAGAGFTSATRRVCVWRQQRRARRARSSRGWRHWRHDVAEAVGVSLLTSALCFAAARIFSCRPCPAAAAASGACPSPANSIFLPFACADATSSYYSPAASLFLPTPEAAVRALFATHSPSAFHPAALALFAATSAALTVLTYGLQLPAGLFVPLIAAGAAAGRLAGTLSTRLLRDDAAPLSASASASDEAVFALLGAAALLGGAMRCALSLCVILLELTDTLSLLPLLLLALLSSRALGDALGGGARSGLYDAHARHVKRAPVLPPAPPPWPGGGGGGACRTTAGGIALRGAFVDALRERDEAPGRVAAALRAQASGDATPLVVADDHAGGGDVHTHAAAPVLVGALRPRAARAALRRAVATSAGAPAVDLRDAASPSRPLLVREGATLTQLHALFSGLGVNCVAVVPQRGTRVIGVVTRAQLLHALDEAAAGGSDEADARAGGAAAPSTAAALLVPARQAGGGSSDDEEAVC